MTVRTLEKSDWRPFFDHLSKMLDGCQAEIEATSRLLSVTKCRPVGCLCWD
jgi:hypothetical protein